MGGSQVLTLRPSADLCHYCGKDVPHAFELLGYIIEGAREGTKVPTAGSWINFVCHECIPHHYEVLSILRGRLVEVPDATFLATWWNRDEDLRTFGNNMSVKVEPQEGQMPATLLARGPNWGVRKYLPTAVEESHGGN